VTRARAHDESADVNVLLPLPPATFHILLAVADEPRHGYAISQDIAARTNGAIKMGFGTLYRSIQRMLEQGLVEEVRERPATQGRDDERRRYYRATRFGAVVGRAEMRRLAELVRLAAATSFALKRS
jgi:DNA-binding PadR family transcriptional regulator